MPEYNLNSIHEVARLKKINYNGRKVQLDILNLDYELEDVARCLLQLTEDDFHRTHQFDNNRVFDAYRCQYKKSPDASTDDLYIKLRLTDDLLLLEIGSFHL